MSEKTVYCGKVPIGGGAPVSIQSMTNTDTRDADATLGQIIRLADAGADIVRCTVPDMEAAAAFGKVRKQSRCLWLPTYTSTTGLPLLP